MADAVSADGVSALLASEGRAPWGAPSAGVGWGLGGACVGWAGAGARAGASLAALPSLPCQRRACAHARLGEMHTGWGYVWRGGGGQGVPATRPFLTPRIPHRRSSASTRVDQQDLSCHPHHHAPHNGQTRAGNRMPVSETLARRNGYRTRPATPSASMRPACPIRPASKPIESGHTSHKSLTSRNPCMLLHPPRSTLPAPPGAMGRCALSPLAAVRIKWRDK